MSVLIDNISEAARGWHRHLVWIAVNVGYIRAEIPHLESQGHETRHIVPWLNIWPYFHERIAALELEAFVAARQVEAGEADLEAIKAPLLRLNRVLFPWTQSLNAITEQLNEGEHGLASVLMNCCGAEILKAKAGFESVVDLFLAILPCMDLTNDLEDAVVH